MDSRPVTHAESTTALSLLPGGKWHQRSDRAVVALLEMMSADESSENWQRLTMLVAMFQSLLHYTSNKDVILLALSDAEIRTKDIVDTHVMQQMVEWCFTEAVVARSTNPMAW